MGILGSANMYAVVNFKSFGKVCIKLNILIVQYIKKVMSSCKSEPGIVAVTSNGEHIIIPNKVVAECHVLTDLVQMCNDHSSAMQIVPLKNIHSDTLKFIVNYCANRSLIQHTSDTKNVLSDLNDHDLQNVTSAAYFLMMDSLQAECIEVLRERIITYFDQKHINGLKKVIL